MKIGIMGGTFDPIHNGHLMLGQAAYEAFGLDEVWFLPNGNPPHKESSRIEASAKERVEMTRLAVSGIPYFRVEPYEAERDAVSCTWQTLEYFRSKYPDDQMFFIIGADSLGYLDVGSLGALTGSGNYCAACFQGNYPTKIPADLRKDRFERKLPGTAGGRKEGME